MPKKKPLKGQPEVHEKLNGLDIHINEFGEIKTNFNIDKINTFLDDNVEDKKLKLKEDTQKEEE